MRHKSLPYFSQGFGSKLARDVFEDIFKKRENFLLKMLQTQVSSTKYFPAQHFLVFHDETRKKLP